MYLFTTKIVMRKYRTDKICRKREHISAHETLPLVLAISVFKRISGGYDKSENLSMLGTEIVSDTAGDTKIQTTE